MSYQVTYFWSPGEEAVFYFRCLLCIVWGVPLPLSSVALCHSNCLSASHCGVFESFQVSNCHLLELLIVILFFFLLLKAVTLCCPRWLTLTLSQGWCVLFQVYHLFFLCLFCIITIVSLLLTVVVYFHFSVSVLLISLALCGLRCLTFAYCGSSVSFQFFNWCSLRWLCLVAGVIQLIHGVNLYHFFGVLCCFLHWLFVIQTVILPLT